MATSATPICRQCGATQDAGGVTAPMVHVASEVLTTDPNAVPVVTSYHWDCLPYDLAAEHSFYDAVIDAAKSGVRGEALQTISNDLGAQQQVADAAVIAAAQQEA